MFALLLKTFRPQSLVEIGVGKGDTLHQFLSEATSMRLRKIQYYGFDTFDSGPPPDETEILANRISTSSEIDRIRKVHFASMELIRQIPTYYKSVDCEIFLFKGNTKETIKKNIENIPLADMIYIDGGHSYETVKSDWQNLKPVTKTGTVIIFDDFNCEKGVSKFVGDYLRTKVEILGTLR